MKTREARLACFEQDLGVSERFYREMSRQAQTDANGAVSELQLLKCLWRNVLTPVLKIALVAELLVMSDFSLMLLFLLT